MEWSMFEVRGEGRGRVSSVHSTCVDCSWWCSFWPCKRVGPLLLHRKPLKGRSFWHWGFQMSWRSATDWPGSRICLICGVTRSTRFVVWSENLLNKGVFHGISNEFWWLLVGFGGVWWFFGMNFFVQSFNFLKEWKIHSRKFLFP